MSDESDDGVQVDGNKIIIPIEVSLQNKEDLRAMNAELQTMKETAIEVSTLMGSSSGGNTPWWEKADKMSDEEWERIMWKSAIPPPRPSSKEEDDDDDDDDDGPNIAGAFRSGIGKAGSFLSSPTGGIKSLAKFIPYIGEALLAIGFAELVIQKVYDAGGWLDRRWKRDIQTEFMGLWSRQQQQNRKVGVQGVIIASSGGFRAMNGVNVENTLRDVRVYGIESKVGYLEKRLGRRP